MPKMAEEETMTINDEQAAEQAKKYSKKVSEDDVADMVDKEEKMKGYFRKVELLKKYWDDVCDVFSLLKDRVTGVYTETPWSTIAALTGALLYVLTPLDLIPDFIPLAGFVDDAAVFAFVLTFAQGDLVRYREWKKTQQKTIEVK
jgi:uncharacterized membrane protein YkvA (DUF1232 family)